MKATVVVGRALSQDPNFHRYYGDVGKTEVLNAQQEAAIFEKYARKGDKAGAAAKRMRAQDRDKIVHNCLRQVVKVARQYASDPDVIKDLISCGNIGILRALETYDPKRNIRFLSYATNYIHLYILEELYSTSLVSVPRWRQKAARKLNRARSEAEQRGIELDDDELCEVTDLSPAQLSRLGTGRLCFPSIDLIAPPHDKPTADHKAIDAETKAYLSAALQTLTVKEAFVLRAYYGFIDEPRSLRQIAAVLGITSERVRQIKTTALAHMEKKFITSLGVARVDDIAEAG